MDNPIKQTRLAQSSPVIAGLIFCDDMIFCSLVSIGSPGTKFFRPGRPVSFWMRQLLFAKTMPTDCDSRLGHAHDQASVAAHDVQFRVSAGVSINPQTSRCGQTKRCHLPRWGILTLDKPVQFPPFKTKTRPDWQDRLAEFEAAGCLKYGAKVDQPDTSPRHTLTR